MGLNYCSTDKTTEAMYEALVNSSPPLPPQGDWDGQDRPKWGYLAKVREYCDKVYNTVAERGVDYGPPAINHERTAKMWSAYLGIDISIHQVCEMNELQKISRSAHLPKADSLIDKGGYCANDYACMES